MGVTQKFGDASLGLHGTIDRTDYADATLPDGSTLALSGDSFTAYGLQTRAGYELTPGVMPFLEVDTDIRRHDQALDTSGFARNSSGQAVQAGTTFELTRILTGEIAGGYAAARICRSAPRQIARADLRLVAGLVGDAADDGHLERHDDARRDDGRRCLGRDEPHHIARTRPPAVHEFEARRRRILCDQYLSRGEPAREDLFGNVLGRICISPVRSC